MATYFHGNSSQSQIHAAAGGGGLQTLILMTPTTTDYNNNFGGYSDTTQPPVSTHFVFLNSSNTTGGGSNAFNSPPSSQPPHQQLLDGIPLASAATSSEDNQNDNISLFHGFLPRVQYNSNNLYNNNQKVVVVDHMEARETPRAQRGLSLTLSSQLPSYGAERELPPASSTLTDDTRVSASGNYSKPGISNNGMQNHVLLSSKYLKAAQQLLDEVVNVGDSARIAKVEQPPQSKAVDSGDNGGKRVGELTTAEKQEIQMKKAKLVNMLDEVEQRYRQYQQQMQMVATMFEEACGIGSAKAYTALALQTISKQFRSIKDAILCQVRIASKSLGEEDEDDQDSNLVGDGNNNNNIIKGSSSSRMKNIDNQLRQQRALQQLGMVRHNAWRPQRGLPERSVSVLRSWLFEHFLHPYPKDSDKFMLAKQAGLTRGQVSNWFINARVRLWKPMVEEMYSEEMKQQEKNGSEEKSSKSEQNEDFNLIRSPEMESISNKSTPKKQHCTDMFGPPTGVSMDTAKPDEPDNEHLSMRFDTEKQRREDGFTLFGGPRTHFINGGFNTYPNNNDQHFPSPYSATTNNGVSLSLGLPHCENLAMSGPHQSFELDRGVENIGDAREFGSIPHRVIVPEYMRESTFRNTRGLMDNYYQTL